MYEFIKNIIDISTIIISGIAGPVIKAKGKQYVKNNEK
ncbi:uncharacterized protein METZ01_LOCUS481076 [marine metagenome]|uniref:Uncharacterized protein n=1 Tax=marine metagenome TaxID=408172 RepID=A0A383C7N9_9ZZZZ